MKDLVLDGGYHEREFLVTESKHGTLRVDGKTRIERLREYKKKYGEEEYCKMLEETGIENPKCIKLAKCKT